MEIEYHTDILYMVDNLQQPSYTHNGLESDAASSM